MRISDWSSDVCSSDLARLIWASPAFVVLRSGYSTSPRNRHAVSVFDQERMSLGFDQFGRRHLCAHLRHSDLQIRAEGRLGLGRATRQRLHPGRSKAGIGHRHPRRSEEHTSELQSLMRISYAVFCLKKKPTYMQLSL